MTAAHDSRMLNAFIDGELDLSTRLAMEDQLNRDSALHARVDALRDLRAVLREGAEYHAAPEGLRQRLSALAAPSASTPKSAPNYDAKYDAKYDPKVAPPPAPLPAAGRSPARRWWAWQPMVSSFGLAAALTLALNLGWWHTSQSDRLADEVVASHVRSTLGQHLVDVASSDHHTVKPWLSSKLDFSPPVAELPLAGSSFLGGRVDYLDGHPVAALVYRQGQHVVNAFVWPTRSKDSAADFSLERGYRIAHWSHGGMAHWVISDVNREEFAAVVQALQLAEGGR